MPHAFTLSKAPGIGIEPMTSRLTGVPLSSRVPRNDLELVKGIEPSAY